MKYFDKRLQLLLILTAIIIFSINIFAEGKHRKRQKDTESGKWAEQSLKNDTMLVKIGNKGITVEDFLYRSTFTVRPAKFKNKNATLNNLISEKILAIEAEKSKTSFLQNPIFLGKLKGIKEQLMREKLYEIKADKKVVLDSNTIYRKYKTSIREYETEFYVIKSDSVSKVIKETLKKHPGSADSIFKSLEKKINKKPIQNVKYLDNDDKNITEALFSSLLDTGTVVGPIKLKDGNNILMRVKDWKDEILFSGEDKRIRWNKIAEKIHQDKAFELWDEYMLDVMKGKRIEYNNEVLAKLAGLAYQYHLNKNLPPDSIELHLNEIPKLDEALDLKSPFFKINGNVWTVEDFKRELVSHPLVYRARFTDQKSFDHQFLYAIADLVRDYYLNKEAYKLGLDTLQDINKTADIWKDSFLAIDQQKSVIDSALEKGLIKSEDNSGILKYWESYLSDLQKRYSDLIKVDYKQFKKIKLTKIDFLAFKPGKPFPQIVPSFPTFISSENLEYIRK
jgi:hypothetical protein